MVVSLLTVQSVEGAKGVLSVAQELTVVGLLCLIIVGLLYHISQLKKDHGTHLSSIRELATSTQKRLDEEYKRGTEDMKELSKNYNIFTTKMIENYKSSMSIVIEKLNALSK